jgi:putative transposase
MPVLANKEIADILIDEWSNAWERHGWMIGQYVIMPDHVHFFCSFFDQSSESRQGNLSKFIQQWKQWTSKRILRDTWIGSLQKTSHIWQREFFDHLLRSKENYNLNWEYVRENPVRKNLVDKSEDWSWQGEIFDL